MEYFSDYEIEHEEIKRVTHPEIVETGPMGPCVGVAILHKKAKIGYIGCDYALGTKTIEDTVVQALSEFGGTKDLKVALVGANKSFGDKVPDLEDSDRLSIHDWTQMLDILKKYGFENKQIKSSRTEKRGVYQNLYLDCNKARIYWESKQE